ncbi:hypothetical protein [Burkholderia ubonensis]|uniref:hypothetical protein n=1 Tax=Burkholderia ubonensis TaxID=101571 RepID=UPI00075F23C5|nr:hypothetical protein [Burkholderia ubonensis]KVP39700.1 hypothetical protein WJ87_05820 [Burkholderia ubonensis]
MAASAQAAATQATAGDKLYLVVLEGGGDINVALVAECVWQWIDLPFESQESGYYEDVPEAVLAEAEKHGRRDWFRDGKLRISIGSYDNDRAISAPGLQFEDVESAQAYAAANNIQIDGTYEGCIY